SVSVQTTGSDDSSTTATHNLGAFLLQAPAAHRELHSFPTRRSSDLAAPVRRTTITWSTPPAFAIASSVLAFSGILRPPRTPLKRSEEHTSELQSPDQLVCRLLLEKKRSRWLFAPSEPSLTSSSAKTT